jgi:hypothetical protein
MPYNLWAPGTCQVTSPGSFMTCPDGGDGTSAPDQFVAYRPDNGGSPIMPGEPMYLQSMQTGKFCRVVLFGGSQQRVACDQSSTEGAAQLVYTGSGASYNNQPFINPGGNQPIYFGSPGSRPQAASFLPPPIPTNMPLSIKMPAGYLRVDGVNGFAHTCTGTGKETQELFVAIDPTDPASTRYVRPGQRTLVRSVQTGLILRILPYTDGPGGVYTVLADQPTLDTGTTLIYSVSGLTYGGAPLKARAILEPLLWSNNTTLSGSSGVLFTPVEGGASVLDAALMKRNGAVRSPAWRARAAGRVMPGVRQWVCPAAALQAPPASWTRNAHPYRAAVLPLMPNIASNIRSGGACRVDAPTSFMVCAPSPGAGNSTQEQFTAVRPDGTSVPVGPGQKVFLKSERTGLYCRVMPVSGRSQVLCDRDAAARATLLNYTGYGLTTADGQPFLNPGGGQAIYFGAPSAQAPAAPLSFTSLAAVPVASGAQYLINLALGNCRTDNASSYVSGVAA